VELLAAEDQKRMAGERAAQLVENGMTVGLGSGSTSLAFVRALGDRVSSGLQIKAVSSSVRTSQEALDAGLELIDLESRLDIAVDGADIIERGSLCAIKGLGGALTREKLVALAAERFILVGDASKIVDHLSDSQPRIPVPVEIVPFGWKLTRQRLSLLGDPVLRESDGKPTVTDNANLIVDLYGVDYAQIPDLGNAIKEITGVVEHGLFLNMAALAIIAGDDGIEEITVS
jgi:ribose 5-phosphate isomerase A